MQDAGIIDPKRLRVWPWRMQPLLLEWFLQGSVPW